MTDAKARPGLASFSLDDEDDIPVPSAETRAAAKQGGERLGFKSDVAAPSAKGKAAPAPALPRPSTYTANFHIRTTPEDRQRYDDFAYRHRIKKGEAMTMLLDLAEEAEAARASKKN